MDMAERKGLDLRRSLCSAERFRESAILLALRCLKTPSFRSSASLFSVTSCDHFFFLLFVIFLLLHRASRTAPPAECSGNEWILGPASVPIFQLR